MRKNSGQQEWIDPVCGMKLSLKTAAEDLEHEGRTYYFCATVCKDAFEQDPGKYIKDHHQPRRDRS